MLIGEEIRQSNRLPCDVLQVFHVAGHKEVKLCENISSNTDSTQQARKADRLSLLRMWRLVRTALSISEDSVYYDNFEVPALSAPLYHQLSVCRLPTSTSRSTLIMCKA